MSTDKPSQRPTILDLMGVAPSGRNDKWLLQALQCAVDLEFATIPPYLCGTWSVIDESDPVRGYIDDIVLQEMLHMGLACNMLATLGGVPDIKGTAPAYPVRCRVGSVPN